MHACTGAFAREAAMRAPFPSPRDEETVPSSRAWVALKIRRHAGPKSRWGLVNNLPLAFLCRPPPPRPVDVFPAVRSPCLFVFALSRLEWPARRSLGHRLLNPTAAALGRWKSRCQSPFWLRFKLAPRAPYKVSRQTRAGIGSFLSFAAFLFEPPRCIGQANSPQQSLLRGLELTARALGLFGRRKRRGKRVQMC